MKPFLKLTASAATALIFLSGANPSFARAPQAAATGDAAAQSAPTASWPEFSGYKRYHGNCSVCHRFDGLGGTFAPHLTKSLKTLDHDAFMEVLVNGRQNGNLAMPAYGADPNVMCFAEDIYTYLKARSDDKLGRGRPSPQPKKPADVAAAENACLGL